MLANRAPKWLGRMILHDELRALGLPFVPEAVAYKPADGWLTYTDTLQAVSVSAAIVHRMRQRIPVGNELRDAAWRCTVAGLGRLPRNQWPTNRQHVADLPWHAAEQRHEAAQANGERKSAISISWGRRNRG